MTHCVRQDRRRPPPPPEIVHADHDPIVLRHADALLVYAPEPERSAVYVGVAREP